MARLFVHVEDAKCRSAKRRARKARVISIMADDDFTVEQAWLLRLDLDALTDKEIGEIRRYYKALKLRAPTDFEETRELIRRARNRKDTSSTTFPTTSAGGRTRSSS
jgi:hypothetical protein